jgi:hypothetical protein
MKYFAAALLLLLLAYDVFEHPGLHPAPVLGVVNAAPPAATVNVLTRHNDNARTSQNLSETILNTSNVNSTSFGKLFSYTVDGQIYGQPLYVQSVSVSGKGVHNVVYVATENDSVYAFDADSASANPTPLWQISFLSTNVKPVPCADIGSSCAITPIVGITSTPVINLVTNTMYLVSRAKTTVGGSSTWDLTLHALDITSGAEQSGSPAVICSGTATVGCKFVGQTTTFFPNKNQNRPGLLLMPGPQTGQEVVLTGMGKYLLAYDASTLKQLASWYTGTAQLWGSGGSIAADSSNNVWAAAGNGTFNVNTGGKNYGDTLAKLTLTYNSTKNTYSFTVDDYFTPSDYACRGTNDGDLGSGGPLILPTQGGSTPDEVIVAGKGNTLCDATAPIYLANRDNLGHVGGQLSITNGPTQGYFSDPAYFQSATTNYVYLAGIVSQSSKTGDNLRAYTITNGVMSSTSVANSLTAITVGASPSVSANGTSNGIVWLVERKDKLSTKPGSAAAVLHAYDATNVGTELYNSTQAGARDTAGAGVKFNVPTIANGKVYVATLTELDVYGLCPCPAP